MPPHDQRARVPAVIRDVGEDRDGYVIGLRESTDPDSWSMLFIECADAEDPQEIDLGMDTYCLVVDPQQVDLLRRGLIRVLTSGRQDAVPEPLHV